MNAKQSKEKLINNVVIFKGVLYGFVFMIILTFIMALFSGFLFSIGSERLNILFLIISVIILLFIGFYVARNVENNGWLNGGFAGLIYMIIIILLGTISMPISISNILLLAFIGMIIGSIGGIIGINL